MRLLWDAWTAYAHLAGTYQARVLLSVVYFAVFGPSVLAARLFGARFMDLDTRQRPSYWLPREPTSVTLIDQTRQF